MSCRELLGGSANHCRRLTVASDHCRGHKALFKRTSSSSSRQSLSETSERRAVRHVDTHARTLFLPISGLFTWHRGLVAGPKRMTVGRKPPPHGSACSHHLSHCVKRNSEIHRSNNRSTYAPRPLANSSQTIGLCSWPPLSSVRLSAPPTAWPGRTSDGSTPSHKGEDSQKHSQNTNKR